MKIFWIEAETQEELDMARDFLKSLNVTEEKRPMTNAEKQRAYRERKKATQTVTESNEKVTTAKEEERAEERVSPLDSPSSLSPVTPYPITPYNPPLPKEDEKEEGKNKKCGRGELKAFGQFVRLSDEEYQRLVKDFGFSRVEQMIERMNDYIGEDETGKLARKYQTRNHNLTLRNWENRRSEEKRQPTAKVTNIPKSQKSFHDMAVERGLVEETPADDVIESFWRN